MMCLVWNMLLISSSVLPRVSGKMKTPNNVANTAVMENMKNVPLSDKEVVRRGNVVTMMNC